MPSIDINIFSVQYNPEIFFLEIFGALPLGGLNCLLQLVSPHTLSEWLFGLYPF